ncbi:hypothetical protein [Actinoplanes aureus]|uniref:hypothetical protein n=1 Tax=Actinoplanes aureus TaxID=2792083 RepID=UPI0018C22211|nr:hypothetical protein [Actinoplanes aureus]
MILPGDSVAVGSAGLLDELTQRQGKEIGSIATTVEVGQWLEPGDGNNGLGRVTATVVAGSGKREASGQGEVTFDVESTNCADMAHVAYHWSSAMHRAQSPEAASTIRHRWTRAKPD